MARTLGLRSKLLVFLTLTALATGAAYLVFPRHKPKPAPLKIISSVRSPDGMLEAVIYEQDDQKVVDPEMVLVDGVHVVSTCNLAVVPSGDYERAKPLFTMETWDRSKRPMRAEWKDDAHLTVTFEHRDLLRRESTATLSLEKTKRTVSLSYIPRFREWELTVFSKGTLSQVVLWYSVSWKGVDDGGPDPPRSEDLGIMFR